MNELANVLLAGTDQPVRLVYGVATAANTVQVRGSSVAVELPAITPVRSGDYCAVLESGADRVIVGPVGEGVIQSWSPAVAQGAGVAGTVARGWYVKRADGTFTANLSWDAADPGTAGNSITVATPFTLPNAADAHGVFRYIDGGTFYAGTVFSGSPTLFGLQTSGATDSFGISPAVTITAGDQLRLTVHGRWA